MKKILYSLAAISVATLLGCNSSTESDSAADQATDAVNQATYTAKLSAALAAQPDSVQARYPARNPQQVLEFFAIKPGMTIVEALPGGGWYSKILLPYLGKDGRLIGADYAADMFPKFGFFSDEMIESKKTWIQTWTAEAEAWRDADSATISAYQMNSMPQSMDGTADAVLFIRALHNLSRFESDGMYLTKALDEAHRVLRSGGTLGVVQHQAPDDVSDEWANGSKGYLKKSAVIKRLEQAGFEYVDSIDVNHNPKDQPGENDIVWRLAPSFATSRDNPEQKAEYATIGESNRMTLKFRKP